ncbi:SpvB/TcaC N-terminal domain-containing protein [Allomesorhizobium camelthorni]|uniref:Toxin n=1 Tax=Allomesorhizobium camelthorni TaxID=475069 RepID=A0A6G4WKH2_9HYPH|nr:SpvB/TcaC N-terminal domain-containing protein [Mesorhizobium camelthorni]NGO54716.1 toxin [Mesorhizobium camelthorni]
MLQSHAPAINLPKGGGAIRGLGEKFAANPVSGTGSMSIPLATSPGRSGFGPQLSLSYDSGSGNGPFGFGWSLSLPSITRKTDKGLPRYLDADDSDVFILSGAEDLVPILEEDVTGKWVVPHPKLRVAAGQRYSIRRYRPRIEGLFAVIERWSNVADAADMFWRSISRDNVTTWYGRTAHSRIADPSDPSRIFSWLICLSHDDKGNATVYGYKGEDSARIFEDSAGNGAPRVHERNRTAQSRAAQRYLKFVRYGNRSPYFPRLLADAAWPEPAGASIGEDGSDAWMFEAVFDYGEHDAISPTANDAGIWPARVDPFSSYRAGFEIRTYRTCQRLLMFHHFPGEAGVERNCLTRSIAFSYSDEINPSDARNPTYTFLKGVAQSGHRRTEHGYESRGLPPIEFEYTEPIVQETVEEVDPASLANLPVGLDGSAYRWIDLHGEGTPGVLTEHAGGWFYKRNVSPLTGAARFAPLEIVAVKPNVGLRGDAEFMDLAGDGQPDLVVMEGSTPGLYEHDDGEAWQDFRPFTSRLNRQFRDPNLRLVDLNGDGHADVLITEDDALVWHPSLAEQGFGSPSRVAQASDEETGPHIVFADGTQAIYLADLSGDGLSDIVRIRNGEVCYWPNLGCGRFGAKISMDNAPWFDLPDHFDHKRIRLADIDGSGTTDIIYLHREGVRLYFNQSGNGWSQPQVLQVFPRIDDLLSIVPTDLLGNGTACLVWSSSLPVDAQRPMRYVNLMGGRKPHLLVRTVNNLGAETRIDYAPSTRFYLQDRRDGNAWITRLPFPVHVVERAETIDHVSRNRFVSRYAYHHGYFDGEEREFRGFGMMEQWDTEQFATLADGQAPASNIEASSHVPPVHTKTWFHTGAYLDRERVSHQFEREYFCEPGAAGRTAKAMLLEDTLVPPELSLEEEREACRALRGSILRREVYAVDGVGQSAQYPSGMPYTVTEQNFAIRRIQPRGGNRFAVFVTLPREAITFHYERNPADPRIQHALTLEVDDVGNVLKQVTIGYGRRASPLAEPWDRNQQTRALLSYAENRVSSDHDTGRHAIDRDDHYRVPLPFETRTFELTGYMPTGAAGRYQASDFVEPDLADPGRWRHKFIDEVPYDAAATTNPCRRLVECMRTIYRRDDLTGLLPLGALQPLALPGETYKLAFTPGLLDQVFLRPRQGEPDDALLPAAERATLLGGQEGHQGGYVDLDGNGNWWIPSGRSFFSPNPDDDAAEELAQARAHFFLPRRYRDPFGQNAYVDFDPVDLLMRETWDGLGNRTTVDANDYRVLQPRLISDPNRNQTEVCFDALGMVVGTAVMGKPRPARPKGDTLAGFVPDLTQQQIDRVFGAADPRSTAAALLMGATTRVVYDIDRFHRTQQANPDEPDKWQPSCSAMFVRETHVHSPLPPQGLKIQLSFNYSDGFGREIQKKAQAEPGPLDVTDREAPSINPRWVASGWTIFNNKGKPVRQYEPFFSASHRFEFGVLAGVSPVVFYDPAGRVVATLHPNHTYDKVVFDPWRQITYDVNDTGTARNLETGDPRTDPDIGGYVAHYFEAKSDTWQTWHQQRIDGALGGDERTAALRAQAHADTPTTVHFDVLGRAFLTVTRNRVVCPGHDLDGTEESLATRAELDIEGNQRVVRDAIAQAGDQLGRIVMRYAYDMLGNRIRQTSMEAGDRWMLNDVAGKPIRAWDSRGHDFTTKYDALRRPTEHYVRGTFSDADPRTCDRDILVDRIEYGEGIPDAEALNLRTRLYRRFDSAGIATNARLDATGKPREAYDFKGNLLRSTRQLISDYTTIPDWGNSPQLDAETFEGGTRYDALDRPIQLVAPHSSAKRAEHRAKFNVIQPVYNEASLLERLDVWLERDSEPSALLDPRNDAASPVGVAALDYDPRGQRLHIGYKNGAGTSYSYDPLTFRLTQLLTVRDANASPDDDPQPPSPGWPGQHLQDLRYTYDPAGNITHIHDDAQQTVFFRNRRVDPSNDYVYDALYRLVEADGREHLGQARGAPIPHSPGDLDRVGLLHPGDGHAMGAYTERYVYDAVGNFLQMQHRGSDPAHAGWTRRYSYTELSQIEDGSGGALSKTSNRLSSTTLNPDDGGAAAGPYQHDTHGNVVRMPHLGAGGPEPNMHWDYKDQLHRTDLGGGGTAYYVYDASGHRVRKVWEKSPGLVEERIYLGGFEIFRRHRGAIGIGTAELERETLHVLDDKQRIALVETRTLDAAGKDGTARQLIRYQFGNHLGSASLELDRQARVISYEEYAPFGSSTYQAVRNQTETAKRYRYTGKERDEESGLCYHGARYYAPWLGRWTSVDPAFLAAQEGQPVDQTYQYVSDRPIVASDPDGRIIWFAVIGIVAIATVTVTSDANAPTSAEDARRAKPAVTNAEFAARTGVIGVSWFAGGAVGDKILLGTGSKVLAGGGGGAFGGVVGSPGDLLVSDLFRGKVSSGGEYVSRTIGGAIGGAALGVAFGGFSRAVSGPATPPPGGFGWHNVFGLRGMRPGRAADIAEKFEARFGDPPEGMYVVGSRAEAHTTGKWPEGSGPTKSDIDVVIQSEVPNVTKWTPEGFEFLKEINPGRVPPGVTGIGHGPGKTLIGSEPGNIPKAGLVDPFIGRSADLPDLSLGPAIKVWPPPSSPPQNLRSLAERLAGPLAGPLVDYAWQAIWGSRPKPTEGSR